MPKFHVEIEKTIRTVAEIEASTAQGALERLTNDPYHAPAASAVDKLIDDVHSAEIDVHEVADWRPVTVNEEGHGLVWERPRLGHVPVQDRRAIEEAVRGMLAGVEQAGAVVAAGLAAMRDAAADMESGQPPVWSKIQSVENPVRWARREPSGWVRYTGTAIQSVRLSWESVQRQLGEWRPRTMDAPLRAVED
jgi:hypothetical protein